MRNTLRYRVNYGNGQVHYTANGTKKECFAYIASDACETYRDFHYIEFQDPDTGEWFPTGNHYFDSKK